MPVSTGPAAESCLCLSAQGQLPSHAYACEHVASKELHLLCGVQPASEGGRSGGTAVRVLWCTAGMKGWLFGLGILDAVLSLMLDT